MKQKLENKRKTRFLTILLLILTLFAFSACSNLNQETELQNYKASTEKSETSSGKGESSESHSNENGGEGNSEGNDRAEQNGKYSISQTFDETINGMRLILKYNSQTNSFVGTVQNTLTKTLPDVRVEVHQSDGIELGPTARKNLGPGEIIPISLKAVGRNFDRFIAHPESGIEANHNSGVEDSESSRGERGESHSSEGGNEGRNEGSEGRESGTASHNEGPKSEGNSGANEEDERAMSSPIIPLSETWRGRIGEFNAFAQYSKTEESIYVEVESNVNRKLCYVQVEPHLKLRGQTVGELGPGKIGSLNPNEKATSKLFVSNEPELRNVKYDSFLIHMEEFSCNGPGPQPHNSEDESQKERSSENRREGNNEGSKGESSEGGRD